MEGFGLIWVEKVSGVFVIMNHNTENMKNKKFFIPFKTRSFEGKKFSVSQSLKNTKTS